jgi:hypothetical protein
MDMSREDNEPEGEALKSSLESDTLESKALESVVWSWSTVTNDDSELLSEILPSLVKPEKEPDELSSPTKSRAWALSDAAMSSDPGEDSAPRR